MKSVPGNERVSNEEADTPGQELRLWEGTGPGGSFRGGTHYSTVMVKLKEIKGINCFQAAHFFAIFFVTVVRLIKFIGKTLDKRY